MQDPVPKHYNAGMHLYWQAHYNLVFERRPHDLDDECVYLPPLRRWSRQRRRRLQLQRRLVTVAS